MNNLIANYCKVGLTFFAMFSLGVKYEILKISDIHMNSIALEKVSSNSLLRVRLSI